MSLRSVIASRSLLFSPFGFVPPDYPRMGQLCRAAFVRYDDTEVPDPDGPTLKLRLWRIVADPAPHGMATAAKGHKKFCMLLDYIDHKNAPATRAELYDSALDGSWGYLTNLSWQDMNDELAKAGVPGYDTLKRKQKTAAKMLDAFDD